MHIGISDVTGFARLGKVYGGPHGVPLKGAVSCLGLGGREGPYNLALGRRKVGLNGKTWFNPPTIPNLPRDISSTIL